MAVRILPSQTYLRECFDYDAFTGLLTWRLRPREHFASDRAWQFTNARFAGRVVGEVAPDGYRLVGLSRIQYPAHRIIWKWVLGDEPAKDLDHKDLNRDNNRWLNLRCATRSQNRHNARTRSDNRCGLKGVTRRSSGKFMACIALNGNRRYLGLFRTAEAAKKAYDEAARELYGSYARS